MTKFAAIGCTALLAALNVQAHKSSRPELLLRVRVENIPGPMLTSAMADVVTIFRESGVKVRWTSTQDREERDRSPVTCSSQAVDVSVIDILIEQRSDATDHPGALAYAMPFAKSGFRIVVFYDRVAGARSPSSPQLLGHAIAHEVGHMVIGTLAHSSHGVMLARWTGSDIASLEIHPLWFTGDDAKTIRRRLDQQHAACFVTAADELVKLSAR
jgi:hypothetical protein